MVKTVPSILPLFVYFVFKFLCSDGAPAARISENDTCHLLNIESPSRNIDMEMSTTFLSF
jgi:hypothetical protein